MTLQPRPHPILGNDMTHAIPRAGRPALLFVHGFCCSHEDWRFQVGALSGEFPCITLDLPGHGESALPPEATMVELARAVNRAKEACGAEKVILVGHSLGCKVIREAFSLSRSQVAGLVFIEGAYYPGEAKPLVDRAAGKIDENGFVPFAAGHFEDMFTEASDPAEKRRVMARLTRMDPAFGKALYLEAVRWDPARSVDTLREMDVPSLVIQSTYIDGALKRQPLNLGMTTPFMDVVRDLVKDSDARVIPGVGHFTMFDAPQAINRELRKFALWVSGEGPRCD